MNDVPPGSPSAMTFIARSKRGGLPVAFGAEAVAVGHQSLGGEAGQLPQPVQIFERVGEPLEAAFLEKCAQAELEARAVAQRVVALAALLQGRGDACRSSRIRRRAR